MEHNKQHEEVIDPSKIKQQYAELKQEQPAQPTVEQIRAQRAEQIKSIEEDIPFLQKLKEVKELEIAVKRADIELATLDVKMGVTKPENIQGLIGQELQIYGMKVRSEWVNRSLEQVELQKRAMEEKAQLEKLQKEAQDKESKAAE